MTPDGDLTKDVLPFLWFAWGFLCFLFGLFFAPIVDGLGRAWDAFWTKPTT